MNLCRWNFHFNYFCIHLYSNFILNHDIKQTSVYLCICLVDIDYTIVLLWFSFASVFNNTSQHFDSTKLCMFNCIFIFLLIFWFILMFCSRFWPDTIEPKTCTFSTFWSRFTTSLFPLTTCQTSHT